VKCISTLASSTSVVAEGYIVVCVDDHLVGVDDTSTTRALMLVVECEDMAIHENTLVDGHRLRPVYLIGGAWITSTVNGTNSGSP